MKTTASFAIFIAFNLMPQSSKFVTAAISMKFARCGQKHVARALFCTGKNKRAKNSELWNQSTWSR